MAVGVFLLELSHLVSDLCAGCLQVMCAVKQRVLLPGIHGAVIS